MTILSDQHSVGYAMMSSERLPISDVVINLHVLCTAFQYSLQLLLLCSRERCRFRVSVTAGG